MSPTDTPSMLITMNAEFGLSLNLDGLITYGDVESKLVDAGFDNYTIVRNLNYAGGTDIELFVRDDAGSLDAVDTLNKFATVVESLAAYVPAATP